MARAAVALGVLCCALTAAPAGGAPAPPTPWNGANPFDCELQQAGYGATVPHPDADPFCVDYDKRHQSIADLGVVDFLSKEPARTALAVDKCFYFQSDHWRGSVVQDDGATKTYEWDGHYFFDKATGDGGVWVTNFNVNGHTFDPASLPGMPPQYAQYFGPGTGGVITHDQVPVDPACVAEAAEQSPLAAPPAASRPPRCAEPVGGVGSRHLGPVALGAPESRVWARLGTPARLSRGFLRYCLRGGGKELVGIPGDRTGLSGGPGEEPAVFLLTTSAGLRVHGIGRGTGRRAMLRAFPHARRWFVQGRTRLYRLRPSLLAGVRDGRVRELAVYDPHAVRGAGAVREWRRRAQ